MAKRKLRRVARMTCLLVGEGKSEKAFFDHLKEIYPCGHDRAVTTKAGNGGSPRDVIDFTLTQCESRAFDQVKILVDTDVPYSLPDAKKKELKKYKVDVLLSDPCLEGLLLTTLRRKPPKKSDACKRDLKSNMTGTITNRKSFAKLFPKKLLDQQRKTIPTLDALIHAIEG